MDDHRHRWTQCLEDGPGSQDWFGLSAAPDRNLGYADLVGLGVDSMQTLRDASWFLDPPECVCNISQQMQFQCRFPASTPPGWIDEPVTFKTNLVEKHAAVVQRGSIWVENARDGARSDPKEYVP